ncbi:ATPase [Pyrococcus sp. ST04]|uniref:DUF6849 domain-containing protein n=1 Tax=Pyrococcus sp. ST04 TaxID=1183377 RepID=UPI0002605C4C|nr:ATPase [Pyrococcus sp. ST04]AFK22960.1 hypothetical protein containing Cdc48 domain [Pyrococcus sp. ST04]
MRRVVLKPLIDIELPQDFAEILRAKLKGKEVKSGDVVGIEILGKELEFKVVHATPSPQKITEKTQILLTRLGIETLEVEFEREPIDVLCSGDKIVVIFNNEVLILNQYLEEIYKEKFEKIIKVVPMNGGLVVVDGRKLKVIKF